MTDPIRNIALDIRGANFIESYRIQAYHGVIHYAQEHPNWRLMFNHHCFSLKNKFSDYRDLPGLGVDGLIFLTWNNTQTGWLRKMGLPAVSLSLSEKDSDIPCVVSDDEEIGREAAEHFIERGFRALACCTSSNVSWEKIRATGFLQAAQVANCHHCKFKYVPSSVNNPRQKLLDEKNATRLNKWLQTLKKPVGIFTTNDTLAFQVLEACKETGIEVPKEIAIVGVDNNVLICNAIRPSLSSVEPNAVRVGYEAAALLDHLISGEKSEQPTIRIPPKGIAMRMSSDVLAVEDPAVVVALRFIRENLADPIGVDDVARAANISRRTLQDRFRHLLGETIAGEISRQRLRRTMTLLLDTNLPVEEIATASGFRRSSYFWNFFHAQTGLSPGAWREKFKGTTAIKIEQHYGTIPNHQEPK